MLYRRAATALLHKVRGASAQDVAFAAPALLSTGPRPAVDEADEDDAPRPVRPSAAMQRVKSDQWNPPVVPHRRSSSDDTKDAPGQTPSRRRSERMPHSLTTAGGGRGQKADEWSRPYVMPARLDRGVDVLHDPVFNKARSGPSKVALATGVSFVISRLISHSCGLGAAGNGVPAARARQARYQRPPAAEGPHDRAAVPKGALGQTCRDIRAWTRWWASPTRADTAARATSWCDRFVPMPADL